MHLVWITEKKLKVQNDKIIWIPDFNRMDGTQTVNPILLSKNLDTVNSVNWAIPGSTNQITHDVWVDDSTITILGQYALQPSSKLNLFLVQFDTALNLIWYNTVADFRGGPANRFNGFYPYRLQKHGDYYYAVGRCLYPNVMVEGFVVKMDLLGNKVWDKRFRYFGKNVVISDFLTYDDSLVLAASYLLAETGPNENLTELYFFSLDTSGNVLNVWPDSITQYNYQIPSLTRTVTGDIVAATIHYSRQTLAAYSELWKLSPTMQTQWRRSKWHGDSLNDQSLLYKVQQWSDGGLLGTGSHWKTLASPFGNYAFMWLLSTDSNGCVDSATCYPGISAPLPVTFRSAIKIYPNPASNTVTIQLPINNPFTVGQVVLQSTSGQQMWEQKVVFKNAKADLPLEVSSGLYTIQITTSQGVFHSKLIVQ